MSAVASLSKSVTLVCWWIAVASTFGFGALFLFGWLSEEFAASEKWKKRPKLFITLAIIGVAGEQISTIAEFAFSEHLQALAETEVARLQFATMPRAVRLEKSSTIFPCLKKAPKGSVFVTYAAFNNEAKETQIAVLDLLRRAGFDARPQPFGTTALVGFSGTKIFMFTHDPLHPPSYATEIDRCFGAEFRNPISGINPERTPWVGPNDVMIGVDADARP